jgi:hypothetical protein
VKGRTKNAATGHGSCEGSGDTESQWPRTFQAGPGGKATKVSRRARRREVRIVQEFEKQNSGTFSA